MSPLDHLADLGPEQRQCERLAQEIRSGRQKMISISGTFSVIRHEKHLEFGSGLARDVCQLPAIQSRRAHVRDHELDQGWTDSLRQMHPDVPMFTFWGYKRERWSRDAGLRLDHLLVSPDLTERLADAGVNRWVRGEADASDPAPAWIELRGASRSTAPKAQ